MARPGRSSQRGLPLLLTLLLCALFSVMHRQSVRLRGHDPVTGIVRDAALVPAQSVTLLIGRWWHVHIQSIFAGPRLAQQNAALQAQLSAVTLQNQRLIAVQTENARLRGLLHFQQKTDTPLLAADVVALKPSPQIDTLTLSRGTHDGVKPQTIVLGPNGALAGQVLDVSPLSCSVLLLSDLTSSVGAQASRSGKSGPVGICEGEHAGRLVLIDLPRDADIKSGDAVTTSGQGGVFPKGILIGTVLSVVLDKTRSLKTAQVQPGADFDHLEDVFLLPSLPKPDPHILPVAPAAPGSGLP